MKIHTYSDVTSFYPRSQRGRRHSTRNFNFFNFYIYFIIIVIFFSPTYQLILAPLLRRCFFGSFETKKKKRKKSRGERINLASTRENFCHFRQFSSHRLPNEKKKKEKKNNILPHLTHAFSPPPCTCYVLDPLVPASKISLRSRFRIVSPFFFFKFCERD